MAFLSRDNLKYSSICQYTSAARQLHILLGLPDTVFDSALVKSVQVGFRRVLGDEANRKLPITNGILLKLIPFLKENSGLKAIILTGFFSFARKANLVAPSLAQFDPNINLCRGSFVFTDWGAIMKLAHTKTVQFYERTLYIPLVKVSNCELCPVQALKDHFQASPVAADKPAFYHHNKTGQWQAYTYDTLTRDLKQVLSMAGLDSAKYSAHSLRRGGASFAHQIGVDLPLIQAQGDWASLSVLCYLSRPLDQRLSAAHQMSAAISDLD